MRINLSIALTILISINVIGQSADTIICHYYKNELSFIEKLHNGLLHGDSALIFYKNHKPCIVKSYKYGQLTGFLNYETKNAIILKGEFDDKIDLKKIENTDSLDLYFVNLSLKDGESILDTTIYNQTKIISYTIDGLSVPNNSANYFENYLIKGGFLKNDLLQYIKNYHGGRLYIKNFVIEDSSGKIDSLTNMKVIYFE